MYLKTFCDSDLPTKGFKTQRADSASIGLCLPRRLKRNTIADKAIPVRKDALTGIVLLKRAFGVCPPFIPYVNVCRLSAQHSHSFLHDLFGTKDDVLYDSRCRFNLLNHAGTLACHVTAIDVTLLNSLA